MTKNQKMAKKKCNTDMNNIDLYFIMYKKIATELYKYNIGNTQTYRVYCCLCDYD